MPAKLVTIYWRDIPAQVTAQAGRHREKALLDARFQHAIDRAATVAGLTGTDEYIAEWRRETSGCGTDMAAAVAAEAARINKAFPAERLERLVGSGGLEN
ncbi:MAG: virulence factor [Acidimicrobiia bacterium]|nr:virulence factor [Actinomycetota bacterium]MBL6924370.1 virulence factor [Acidimicrobiia bacterium]MBL6926631.1 virulence factor [Acidimicrobiia bacterium]